MKIEEVIEFLTLVNQTFGDIEVYMETSGEELWSIGDMTYMRHHNEIKKDIVILKHHKRNIL